MKSEISPKTIRRSVALPYKLIEEVLTVAPPELRENLNRLVTVALQDFVIQRKKRSFEESMAQMAADPAIRTECAVLSKEFAIAEVDGLKNEGPKADGLKADGLKADGLKADNLKND